MRAIAACARNPVLALILAVCLIGTLPLAASGETESGLADRVDPVRLVDDIKWLSDDARNGRLATTEAEEDVVTWIAQRFADLGLTPLAEIRLDSTVHRFPVRTSFYPWDQATGGSCTASGVVFLSGTGANVIAVLPGELDPNEFVIVSAHHDHLGPCGESVRNGADDNATGVAAMLEVARILSEAGRRPEKSVVFVAFGAEEIGRLGSKAFTRLLIEYDLDRSCVLLNLDMLGASVGAPRFATLFGDDHPAAAELVSAVFAAAKLREIPVVSAGSVIEWSDHVSLAEYRIPAVTMTASAVMPAARAEADALAEFGSEATAEAVDERFALESMLVHHPNYHRTTDVAEALDTMTISEMTRVVVLAVSLLASPNPNL